MPVAHTLGPPYALGTNVPRDTGVERGEAQIASTGAAYGQASPRSEIFFFASFFAFPRVSGRFGRLQFFSSRGGPQTQNDPRTPAIRKYLR